jgi:aminoglycoside phosphotransferase (APT) family kinase protein
MGRRIPWGQVPERVRSAVEVSLGSSIVEAVTQEGGYSPGAAARVRLATGRRAFVKALSVDLHSASAALYRNEAAVMPHLPPDLPVPRLLDVHDDGTWVALVFEDVEGSHPEIPWRQDQLDRVTAAIADLSAALDPSPWPSAPTFADVNSGVIRAWQGFATSPPPDLDTSVRTMLDRLADDDVDLEEVVRGDALLHNDIRSDNILLTPQGRVVFVDWGMPCKGAVSLDLMMFAFTAAHQGGVDADLMVRRHPLTRHVTEGSIDVLVAAGYAAYRLLAQRPMDPVSNAYHLACAEASLRWLQFRAFHAERGRAT